MTEVASTTSNPAAATGPSEQNPRALPWPRRRALATSLAKRIAATGASRDLVAQLRELAQDPKCEVRKEVADSLVILPDSVFPKLAALLIDDANAFVCRSTRRALERRQRDADAAVRKRRCLQHIEKQYANIEKHHGTAVAEKARKMAEQLYDVLVGATVHDMRNTVTPLESSIVSLQQKLEDRCLDPSDLGKHLPRMRRKVEWLNRMLDDMKTYSQCTPETCRCERVEAIVEEAAAMARDGLKAAGRLPGDVRLETCLAKGLTVVVARDHVVRAIANIIKNAFEAFADSPTAYRAGTIRVVARAVDSGRLEVVVEDDGVGLSEGDLADVRRFVPGGTSKAGGTGFGLPTARRMIEAHGGSLNIESAEGTGTVVTVALPSQEKGEAS
jgi:signal transduction histidine kinase